MHFKMLCAICFNLDQSKILSSGNGLDSNISKYMYRKMWRIRQKRSKEWLVNTNIGDESNTLMMSDAR